MIEKYLVSLNYCHNLKYSANFFFEIFSFGLFYSRRKCLSFLDVLIYLYLCTISHAKNTQLVFDILPCSCLRICNNCSSCFSSSVLQFNSVLDFGSVDRFFYITLQEKIKRGNVGGTRSPRNKIIMPYQSTRNCRKCFIEI